jgi:hypothetical protein
MSNQIIISSGAKVRDLNGVLTGTSGIVSSVPLGAANGVATLDSGGKVPVSQLPSSVVTYLGTWNAATNTPTLVNGTGDAGDMYICNVAGTVNFGAGPVTFAVGDWVLYGSGTWQKSNGQNGTVTSVAVTESGDALTITGSPITTAGTINIGFTGTNSQYVNGAGGLTTFPTLLSSVGLSMPSAFSVANSPLTANGTIAVTGAGTISQYIRGDGSLATLPTAAQEAKRLITEVYNNSGATLTKGTVVYINGGQGNLPTITKALATSDATSAQTYGLVQTDITNMNNGFVVVIGSLMDLDTQAFTEGTQLYLSGTTAGAYTSTKPSAPIHLVYVAIVVRSHPTQGVIEVKIQNGVEMDEIHDVQITSIANGNILQYDSSTSLWKNVAGTTTNIAEGTRLYYTDARSRAALSFAAGSGAYNSTTGVITIPTNTNQLTNGASFITLASLSGGAGISYNNTTGVIASTITQYTDALARAAISLTTTGTSGAATYNNTTGVFNIPNYSTDLSGYVPYTGATAAVNLGANSLTARGITVSKSAGISTISFPAGTNDAGFIQHEESTANTGIMRFSVGDDNDANDYFAFGNTGVPNAFRINANGIVSIGTWQGTAIADAYIESAATWNAKQNALTNPVTGTGNNNYIAKFSSTGSTIANSIIRDDATRAYINQENIYFGVDAQDDVRLGLVKKSGIDPTIAYAEVPFTISSTAGTSVAASNTFVPRLTIDLSGNIGMGTGVPSGASGLAFVLNSGASQGRICIKTTATGNASGDGLQIGMSGTSAFIEQRENDVLTFATNSEERLRIEANGVSSFLKVLNASLGLNVGSNSLGTDRLLNVSGTAFTTGGNQFAIVNNPTMGTLTTLFGYYGGINAASATTGYTMYLATSGGTITNKWGIYQEGSNDKNYFSANVLIGSTTDNGSKLQVNGSATFSSDVTLSGASGTRTLTIQNNTSGNAVLSLVAAGSDGGAITYNRALSQMIFSNSGAANAMAITSGGNVGIGTIDPQTLLQVGGFSGNNAIAIGAGVTGVSSLYFADGTGGALFRGFIEYQHNGDFMRIGTSATDAMRILSTGNVLVATTTGVSGGGALQVNGNVNINGVFQINGTTIGGGGGSGVTGSGTTNFVTKWTGGSTIGNSVIQDTGTNVGIGAAPLSFTKLYVTDTGANITGGNAIAGTSIKGVMIENSNNADESIGLWFRTGNNHLSGISGQRFNSATGWGTDLRFYTHEAGTVDLTYTRERMRITEEGNILIGTLTNNGYKLQINGGASFAFGGTSVFRGSSGAGDVLVANSGSTLVISGNTSIAGTLASTGTITVSTGDIIVSMGVVTARDGFYETSDARAKTLIEDNYFISSIKDVKAKLYKKEGNIEIGYYAQDIKDILPSSVKEGTDGFLSLSYAQVHTAKIAYLEAEIAELKELIKSLL